MLTDWFDYDLVRNTKKSSSRSRPIQSDKSNTDHSNKDHSNKDDKIKKQIVSEIRVNEVTVLCIVLTCAKQKKLQLSVSDQINKKHILYKNINVTCVEDWPSIVYNLVICSSFKEIKNIRDVILMQNST